MLALVVPAGIAWMQMPLALWVAIPLALIAVTGDVLRARSDAFNGFIESTVGRMIRAEERPDQAGAIQINGATWILITAALLLLVLPVSVVVPALTVFLVADAAAALVGRRVGRLHWPRSARTVEGSAAFVLVGLALMAAFPAYSWGVRAVAVLLGCVAEALPGPFNDNIRVPITIAVVLALSDPASPLSL